MTELLTDKRAQMGMSVSVFYEKMKLFADRPSIKLETRVTKSYRWQTFGPTDTGKSPGEFQKVYLEKNKNIM